MAEAADDDDDEEGGKKGGKGKIIIIAVVALLLLGGGGGGAAYFLLAGGDEKNAEGEMAEGEGEEGGEVEEAEAEPVEPEEVSFVELPDILVNIATGGGRARFLKLRASLEVAGDQEAADAVERLSPRIMDGFQFYLRALTIDELRGAAGMHRLKEELRSRVNDAIAPLKINDVLIKEMLVQ